MAIQRKARVAPFSTKTPLVSPKDKGGKEVVGSSGVARPHIEWFASIQKAVNESAEISSTIPANSNSPGETGTIVPFAAGIYVCVGPNVWIKIPGASF